MLIAEHKNFKCEDCGSDKFTMIDNLEWGMQNMELNCAGKDCGASYTFTPEMKQRMSHHPTKICSCNQGSFSKEDNYCSGCGKKNPYFVEYRKNMVKDIVKPKGKKKVKNDNKQKKKA